MDYNLYQMVGTRIWNKSYIQTGTVISTTQNPIQMLAMKTCFTTFSNKVSLVNMEHRLWHKVKFVPTLN
jgi:hypothetical protein